MCRHLIGIFQFTIRDIDARDFRLFAFQELTIARMRDYALTQHLTNNGLNVLVVDLYTLQAVDVLDFLDQIRGQFSDTPQAQNIVRAGRTFRHNLAFLDMLAWSEGTSTVAKSDDGYNVLVGGSLFGIPLPLWLAPTTTAHEEIVDGRFHFDVEIGHPLTGMIVLYRGWLQPAPSR